MIDMIKEEHKYSELTAKIIGCAMKVHSALGNGFQEVIYQRALEIEMADERISFSREYEIIKVIPKSNKSQFRQLLRKQAEGREISGLNAYDV
jgi:hypothetical protein